MLLGNAVLAFFLISPAAESFILQMWADLYYNENLSLEAGGCAVRASPVRLGSLAQPQRRGTSP